MISRDSFFPTVGVMGHRTDRGPIVPVITKKRFQVIHVYQWRSGGRRGMVEEVTGSLKIKPGKSRHTGVSF